MLLFFNGYIWLAGITLVANFMMEPLAPLGDFIGARLVNKIQLDYGRVRLWGSLGFIVGLGNDAILWSTTGRVNNVVSFIIKIIATTAR